MSPETFMRLLLQRLMGRKVHVVVGVGTVGVGRGLCLSRWSNLLRSGSGLLIGAVAGLLRKGRRNDQRSSEGQREKVAGLHVFNSSKNVPEPRGGGSGKASVVLGATPCWTTQQAVRRATFLPEMPYITSAAILGRGAEVLVLSFE